MNSSFIYYLTVGSECAIELIVNTFGVYFRREIMEFRGLMSQSSLRGRWLKLNKKELY